MLSRNCAQGTLEGDGRDGGLVLEDLPEHDPEAEDVDLRCTNATSGEISLQLTPRMRNRDGVHHTWLPFTLVVLIGRDAALT